MKFGLTCVYILLIPGLPQTVPILKQRLGAHFTVCRDLLGGRGTAELLGYFRELLWCEYAAS